MSSATLVVCAYHDVGYYCITELLRQGARIAAIFTHEDSLTEKIWFASVRALAENNGIPCRVTDINLPDNVEYLKSIRPDFLFSFYYRLMVRKEVLAIPRNGALNLHGSLLPKYRGRVPVNWAVINGETETGATLHYMVEKPDAGDIVDQERISIEFTDTSLEVFHKITDAAVRVLSRSWPLLLSGKAERTPMDLSAGSYFGGRRPADGQIDWGKSAEEIYNLIRGVTHPYPGAFTYLDGKKVFIWKALPGAGAGDKGTIVSERPLTVGTGDGLLEVLSLQFDGEEERPADDFPDLLPCAGKRFESFPA